MQTLGSLAMYDSVSTSAEVGNTRLQTWDMSGWHCQVVISGFCDPKDTLRC